MILNNLFRKFGFHVKKYEKPNYDWLKKIGIKTIIDVGANEGQFALEYAKVFPEVKIMSFEPVNKCYQKLVQNTKKLNIRCFNFGLGETDSALEMNVYNHSPSSSILQMEKLHEELYPFSKGNIVEKILIKRLDDVIDFNENNIFLKIDVQGYEDMVLKGGSETLKRVKVILIETSYYELYKNQPLFEEIFYILYKQGFAFKGNLSQTFNKNDGSVVYADSIFIKT